MAQYVVVPVGGRSILDGKVFRDSTPTRTPHSTGWALRLVTTTDGRTVLPVSVLTHDKYLEERVRMSGYTRQQIEDNEFPAITTFP